MVPRHDGHTQTGSQDSERKSGCDAMQVSMKRTCVVYLLLFDISEFRAFRASLITTHSSKTRLPLKISTTYTT